MIDQQMEDANQEVVAAQHHPMVLVAAVVSSVVGGEVPAVKAPCDMSATNSVFVHVDVAARDSGCCCCIYLAVDQVQ
jgi:hypothetical protein